MGKWLFLLFTVVPALEIFLLVRLGGVIGAGPTLALVLFTGIVGAALARHEGFRVITDWQASMAEGRLPPGGVLSGLLVLVGGVLLVTPGLLTDVIGFSLLIPWTRTRVATYVRRWAERALTQSSASGPAGQSQVVFSHVVMDTRRSPRGSPVPDTAGPVIDVTPVSE